MKKIDTKNLDEDAARTLVAQLGLHSAGLRSLLANSKAETVQPPNLAAGDVIANIDLLVAHVTQLESRLGSNCPQFAPGAGQVSRLPAARAVAGLSAGERVSASPKLSITERVLKARGVGSLEELRTSLSDLSHEEITKSARRLKPGA
jgi:hypothetical protein